MIPRISFPYLDIMSDESFMESPSHMGLLHVSGTASLRPTQRGCRNYSLYKSSPIVFQELNDVESDCSQFVVVQWHRL